VPPRKERVPVVLDTNIIIGFYLSKHPQSAISRVFRLWRDQRRLQLIVSNEVIEEYLEVLERLGVARIRINHLAKRFQQRQTVTKIRLGGRPTASRDPEDNIMLAAAIAGRARFLITNDKDLLDISETERRRFQFEIMRPVEFLMEMGD
jgi:uncharacterized protein